MRCVNTGIGFKKWRNIEFYNAWFVTEFKDEFSCENFRVYDWVLPEEENFFFRGKKVMNEEYVASDGKHPSCLGSKQMFKRWASDVPGLAAFDVAFSADDSEKYPCGKLT